MFLLLSCLVDEPATEPEGDAGRVEMPAPEQGFQLHAGPFVVPAYDEVYHCVIAEIDAPLGTLVQSLEHRASDTVHHFNVWGLQEEPEGGAMAGDCDDLWSETNMALSSPLYASQTTEFEGSLPEGVAAELPARWVLMEVHTLNPTAEPLWAEAWLNVNAIDPADVEHLANGLYGSNADLRMEPGDEIIATQRCYVDVDMEIIVLGSHYHQLGKRFEIWKLGEDDEPSALVYESEDYTSPELLFLTEDPIHLDAGSGFEWRCFYENTTDSVVDYGPDSSDEMCMMVGIYYPDDGFKICDPTR